MTYIPIAVRRVLLAGAAVLVLGGAAVGIAAAQTQPSTPNAPSSAYSRFVNALASRLQIDPAKLQTAITQARSDAGLPAANGFPGAAGPRGHGFRGGFDLKAIATYLGMQPQDLRTELQTKSLATIAGEHQKTAADVANQLKTAINNRIDQAVQAGRLTADQGNQQKTQAATRIDQLVNQVMPQRDRGAEADDPDA